jgi:putative addiction module CopG family antidote
VPPGLGSQAAEWAAERPGERTGMPGGIRGEPKCDPALPDRASVGRCRCGPPASGFEARPRPRSREGPPAAAGILPCRALMSLPDEVKEFVRAQLEAGHFQSVDEVVFEALRLLHERGELRIGGAAIADVLSTLASRALVHCLPKRCPANPHREDRASLGRLEPFRAAPMTGALARALEATAPFLRPASRSYVQSRGESGSGAPIRS